MNMTYPTAAEAREQAGRTIYGASRSALSPAIERAQWAAVREFAVTMIQHPEACDAGFLLAALAGTVVKAERHLEEGVP